MGFGSDIAAEAVGGVITAVALGVSLRFVNALNATERNDVEVSRQLLALRRWLADEDRSYGAAVAGSNAPSSQMAKVRDDIEAVKRAYLHRWRDRATDAIWAYQSLRDSETLAHHILRRARRRPLPRLELTDAQREVLRTWRASATEFPPDGPPRTVRDDPTEAPGEEIRDFEAHGLGPKRRDWPSKNFRDYLRR